MRNFILENIVLPVADDLSGTSFMKELRYWRNVVDKLSLEELKKLQQEKLNNILRHAVTHIPYYKNLGIKLSDNPLADVKQFPIMNKKLMKDNIDKLLIYDKQKMVVEKSSGSSGIQGEVYMTLNENRKYQAVQTYLWEWNGYRIGKPIMQTGITPYRGTLKTIKDFLFATQYVNAYNISYAEALKHLIKAKENKTKIFGGYASSLNVFAEVALKENVNIQFESVISWGDKLFHHYKQNILQAFGNPTITELYGTTEGFVISGTCKEGNHHQLLPQTYLELLDKDGNEVQEGELGYVVVTRLDAFSFPLIRFYLGDLAIKKSESEKCNCGKTYPILEKIVGRDTDLVHTPSGKTLIVHFFTGIMEHFEQIQQFKVIQRKYGHIEIEFIPADNFNENTLELIKAKMYDLAKETFPIEFNKVTYIAPTASGKPQIIQNLIATKLIN